MKKLATLSIIFCLGISSVWAAPGDAQTAGQSSAQPQGQQQQQIPQQEPPQGQTSIDSASPNRIPAGDPCPSFAKQFLIRGSYDSSEIGSRLWNLAKIHRTSAPNDPEKTCLEEVSKQANSDEEDYWDYIAKKYKCEDDHGRLPKERPAACPEKQWNLIAGSVNWLKVLDEASSSGAQGTTANGCPPPQSSFGGPLRTIADVTGVVTPGGHPEPVQRTINSGASLGTILAQQQPNHCALITDKSKLNQTVCEEFYKDDKSCGAAPSSVRDAEKCVAGLAKGIIDSVKDVFVDSAKMLVGAGSFLKAVYKGGVGTFAREYLLHPSEVIKKIWEYLKPIPDAIMNMGATQMQTWQCYNNAARWDMGCSAVGYLGMDALMFVPGFQELAIAKLGKLPVIGKALEGLEIASEATIGKVSNAAKNVGKAGVILVGEGIVKAGEVAYKILKWVGKASSAVFKKLTWFSDSSSGLEVAKEVTKDGSKILIKVGENVEEVNSAEEAAKFNHAIESAEHNRSLAHEETNASRKIAEENAAEKGGAKASTHEGEAPQSGDASVTQPTTEEPKKGFLRRALDNYKDPDRKLKQMELKISKETAPLPEGYYKDPVLPPTATLEEKAAQLQQNGERAADFLGMKLTDAGEATIKDAKGVEQTFKLTEDGDGVGWFTKGNLPDKIKPDFTVNIDIPPEKMAKALPGVLSRAEYRGAETYFIGGSTEALQNGGRLMIAFGDAKEAKRFQESVEFFLDRNFYNVKGTGIKKAWNTGKKVVSLTVNRPVSRAFKTLNWGVQATVESSVLSCFDNKSCQRHVYTAGTVFNDAKLKCNQDNLCICKLYFQAGINPDNDEPIETSPFTCTTATVNANPGTATTEVSQQYTGSDGQAIQLSGSTRAPETPEQMAARLKLEQDKAAGLSPNDPQYSFDAANYQHLVNPDGDVQPMQGKP